MSFGRDGFFWGCIEVLLVLLIVMCILLVALMVKVLVSPCLTH